MLAKVTGLHTSDGGVPKLPVEVLEITTNGCIGDSQNDLKHHGGVEKAVCIFQQEIIEKLNHEGHPISAGSTGENVLIQGIEIGEIQPGTIVKFPNELALLITFICPWCKLSAESERYTVFFILNYVKFLLLTYCLNKLLQDG